jgi:hypothetical protein
MQVNLGGWVYMEVHEPVAVGPTSINLSCQTVKVLTTITHCCSIEVELYCKLNH